MRLLAAFLLLLLAAGPAAAEGIVGVLGPTDHRVPVEPDKWPWSSIGRVNHEGNFCTGTLIAPREVLTAAHCLYDKRLKNWVAPHEVHFVAGYARGAFRAHSVAERFTFAPDHAPPSGTARDLPRDWAIVTLKEPVALKPVEIEAIPAARFLAAAAGGELIRAGYSQDRAHLLAMHRGCKAVAAYADGVILHQCDSNHGDSGSPLLLFRDGVPKIVGIHLAVLRRTKDAKEGVGAAVSAAVFAGAAG